MNAYFSDVMRIILALLFCGIAAQIIWILFYYGRVYQAIKVAKNKNKKGMLPLHVLVVSVLFLALAAEALWHHFSRLGLPGDNLIWYDVVVFGGSNYGIWLVLRYEYLRHKAGRKNLHPVTDSSPEDDTV